ncbi:MAG: NYN domain-containing protein [bacterium]
MQERKFKNPAVWSRIEGMFEKEKNYAYIDGANLNNAMRDLGWKLDYRRFRVWLQEKYSVRRAYLFIGLIPKYNRLYTYLQEAGFTLIFKEVIYDGKGSPKGNCDADLVLQVVKDTYEHNFTKTLLVSSDGDYSSLVSFLIEKDALLGILSPSNEKRCSVLLKRTGAKIFYINDKKNVLRSRK